MSPVPRFVLPIVCGLLAVAPVLAQAKPDFSGTWTMVAAKSDFGPMAAPEKMTRTITHHEPAFKVVTTQSGGATGDTTIDTTFSTDGKPTTNSVNGSTMTTEGHWDGAAVYFHSTLAQPGGDLIIDDRYELSDAGKTLTLSRKITAADATVVTRIVMSKSSGE